MKLTKTQLKQLIKEELGLLLNETKRTPEQIAKIHQKAFGPFEEDPEEAGETGKDPAKAKFYDFHKTLKDATPYDRALEKYMRKKTLLPLSQIRKELRKKLKKQFDNEQRKKAAEAAKKKQKFFQEITKHTLKQFIREQLEDEVPEDERDVAQTSSEIMIDKAVSALIEGTYDFDPPQEQLDELENKARDLLNDPELISMLEAIEGAGSEFN